MEVIKLTAFFVFISMVNCDFGEILDLSWPYDNHTIFWPGVKPFGYTKKHEGPGASGGW